MKKNPHMISLRLTDNQFAKLQFYSEETGYSQSELLRKMIDNADDVTMMQNQKITNEKIKSELKTRTELKYQNYLFSNLTKNMNQIAHYLNKYKANAKIGALDSAFQTLEKQINDIKEKLKSQNKKEAGKIGNN